MYGVRVSECILPVEPSVPAEQRVWELLSAPQLEGD